MARTAETSGSRSVAGGRSPWLIAFIVSMATFMEVLDITIVNVALRHIAGSLAAGYEESTWILTSYLISNAVIMPVSGWLSGVIGRKRYYMLCVALFTASSLLCGLAPSLGLLIFFRVLQGLGGGGLAPTEQSFLADSFPPEKRSQAFAVYGIAVILAPTIGPTLGGWITDHLSWHWVFFINVPMGLLSLSLVQTILVEPETLQREQRERLSGGLKVDWVGFACVALWLGCLEVVLDKGQIEDWLASHFIIVFACASLTGFVLLIPWELTRKDPIVDLRLFADRHFAASWLAMLAVGMVLFSTTQLFPQLLQQSFDYDATLSGFALLPGGVAMLIVMTILGRFADQMQPRYLVIIGATALALAMWHMSSFSPGADFSFFVWGRIFQMIGMPFLFLPITSASYAHLPPEKTSQASALINVARILGGSIGIALSTTVLAQREQMHHARLSEHAIPTLPQYQDAIAQASRHFMAQGSAGATAQRQAFGWVGEMVQSQATFLAFIDVFVVMAVIAACIIPLAFLLSHVRREKAETAV